MKKLIFLFLMTFACFTAPVMAQAVPDNREAAALNQIPGERIYVHYNTSLLFSGEYIYFKIYNVSAETGLLSPMSKVAYVELIGEDGTSIFNQKVHLNNGTGRGDFFLPTSVPSGNYKLLGYTHRMLSGNETDFFKADIAVVNPYRGDQSAVTPPREHAMKDQGARTSPFSSEGDLQRSSAGNAGLTVTPSAKTFGKRQEVTVKINSSGSSLGEGVYSVSVRRAENFGQPPIVSSLAYFDLEDRISALDNQQQIVLPELRGDLLWGRITAKDGTGGARLQNKKVVLSVPGEDYLVKVSDTNEKGEFFFNLSGDYSGSHAFLEVLGEGKDLYSIRVGAEPEIDHSLLQFNKFYLAPAMEERILQRSVHNQIENAYYGLKPDTLLASQNRKPFYEMEPILYDLDDYTRFPTVRETFVEIIKEAYVRSSGGRPVVRVRSPELASDPGLPPLLIVDGLVVQDHAAFVDFPAQEIQTIGVVRDNYYLGPQMFQGVVDVTTINGIFEERYSPEYREVLELQKALPAKRYYQQTYTPGNLKLNIPDFRYQLLWSPEVVFTGEEVSLKFFTSDITGDFEIRLEGITKEGNPVSIQETITVVN